MARYILTRVVLLIPILLGITLLSFIIINILPGDVAIAMLGVDGGAVDPRALEMLRSDLGLDRPLHIQYLSWLGGVLRGDFGNSLALKVAILPEIMRRLPVTLELAIISVILGLIIGVPLGFERSRARRHVGRSQPRHRCPRHRRAQLLHRHTATALCRAAHAMDSHL
jgi:peptide/nickel transport system permease protein